MVDLFGITDFFPRAQPLGGRDAILAKRFLTVASSLEEEQLGKLLDGCVYDLNEGKLIVQFSVPFSDDAFKRFVLKLKSNGHIPDSNSLPVE